jgi:RNA-binding protein YhbY
VLKKGEIWDVKMNANEIQIYQTKNFKGSLEQQSGFSKIQIRGKITVLQKQFKA